MSLVCAISGTSPKEPVLSSTGYIFERRLIEKELDENSGKCPITGAAMTKTDLMTIKTSKMVVPRPVTGSSIPGLLSTFQNEWDSFIREIFVLKSNLQLARSELSQALYQHDAATRVIARLIRQRDSFKARIDELEKQLAGGVDVSGLDPSQSVAALNAGISSELMDQMQERSKELLQMRKKRKISPTVATPENLRNLKCRGCYPLHSITQKGVLCVDVSRRNGRRIYTGGLDGSVCLFDLDSEQTVTKLTGHLKRVNSVKSHLTSDIVITGSNDRTIRIWCSNEEGSKTYQTAHLLKNMKAPVLSVTLHPLDNYFAASNAEGLWCFYEIDSGTCLTTSRGLNTNYNAIAFHPDGMILGGAGADGAVHIWDVKATTFRATLSGHQAPLTDISFSENGYYMATSSKDGTIRLWDLRKSLSFQTIVVESDNVPVNSVKHDYSGRYLVCGSKSLKVYSLEGRTSVVETVSLSDHEDFVTDACFGEDAKFLVSTSLDRTVRLWSPDAVQGTFSMDSRDENRSAELDDA